MLLLFITTKLLPPKFHKQHEDEYDKFQRFYIKNEILSPRLKVTIFALTVKHYFGG